MDRLRGLGLLNVVLALAVIGLFAYNLLARMPPAPVRVEAPAFTPPQVVLPTGKSVARRRAEAAARRTERPAWETAPAREMLGTDGQRLRD